MSRLRQTYKIGDVVYEGFKPRNPGVVIDVGFDKPSLYYGDAVKVRFLIGGEKNTYAMLLADFHELIEDHRRKLNTHLTNLRKLTGKEKDK